MILIVFVLFIGLLVPVDSFALEYLLPGYQYVFYESKKLRFPFLLNEDPEKLKLISNSECKTKFNYDVNCVRNITRNRKLCYLNLKNPSAGYYTILTNKHSKKLSFSVVQRITNVDTFVGVADIWQFGKTASVPLNNVSLAILKEVGVNKVRLFLKYAFVKKYGWEIYDTVIRKLKKSGIKPLICIHSAGVNPEDFKIFIKEVVDRYHSYTDLFEIGNEVNVNKMWKYSLNDYISVLKDVSWLRSKYNVRFIAGATSSFALSWWKKFIMTVNKDLFDGISVHIYRRIGVTRNDFLLPLYSGRHYLYDDFFEFYDSIVKRLNKPVYITEVGFNTINIRKCLAGKFSYLEQAEQFFDFSIISRSFGVKEIYNFQLFDTFGLGTGLFMNKFHSFSPKPIVNVVNFLNTIGLSKTNVKLVQRSPDKYIFVVDNKSEKQGKFIVYIPLKRDVKIHLAESAKIYYNIFGQKCTVNRNIINISCPILVPQ